MNESEYQEAKAFLDEVRAGGWINMNMASPLLKDELGISKELAREYHKRWRGEK